MVDVGGDEGVLTVYDLPHRVAQFSWFVNIPGVFSNCTEKRPLHLTLSVVTRVYPFRDGNNLDTVKYLFYYSS